MFMHVQGFWAPDDAETPVFAGRPKDGHPSKRSPGHNSWLDAQASKLQAEEVEVFLIELLSFLFLLASCY